MPVKAGPNKQSGGKGAKRDKPEAALAPLDMATLEHPAKKKRISAGGAGRGKAAESDGKGGVEGGVPGPLRVRLALLARSRPGDDANQHFPPAAARRQPPASCLLLSPQVVPR